MAVRVELSPEIDEFTTDRHGQVIIDRAGKEVVFPVRARDGEEHDVTRFLGMLEMVHSGHARAIFIPPDAGDDGLVLEVNPLFANRGTLERAHIYILAPRSDWELIPLADIYDLPVATLFDPEIHQTALEFISNLIELTGPDLRIVSPGVIKKYLGGRPDEINTILKEGVLEPGERRTQSAHVTDNDELIWQSGLSVSQFVKICEDQELRVRTLKSYEEFFLEFPIVATATAAVNQEAFDLDIEYEEPNDPDEMEIDEYFPLSLIADTPYDAIALVDLLLARGAIIPGLNSHLSSQEPDLLSLHVLDQIVFPPHYAIEEIKKRIQHLSQSNP